MKLNYQVHPNSKFPYPYIFSIDGFMDLPKSKIIEQLDVFGLYWNGPVHVSMDQKKVERFRWVLRDNMMAFKTQGDAMLAKMSLDL